MKDHWQPGFCEKCWDEAYDIDQCNGKGQGTIYNELIRSRPVTYHEKQCATSKEVPAQEVQTQNKVPSQKKRGTKGKSKWES